LAGTVSLAPSIDQAAADAYIYRRTAAAAQILEVTPAGALAAAAPPIGRDRGKTLEVRGPHSQPPERGRSITTKA